MAGLLWRRKALVAAPLIIMLCFLIGIFAYDARALWRISSEIGEFGLVAFPFVFFGVLTRERSNDPGTDKDKLRTVDVTPLAKLVEELDVSATFPNTAARDFKTCRKLPFRRKFVAELKTVVFNKSEDVFGNRCVNVCHMKLLFERALAVISS